MRTCGVSRSTVSAMQNPYDLAEMTHFRCVEAWQKYAGNLSWGRGQTMAILDDGCDLSAPQWQVELPWGPKVIAGYNTVEQNDDPSPVPPGYHGTTVGYPSSINHDGICGVAFNNHVAHLRSVTVVHLVKDESLTLAAGLQWVINHHQRYNITAVNLSPLDDIPHQEPVPTAIDPVLRELRKLNIWVSAPCGNNGYTRGVSWPACQPDCFAIGAVRPGSDEEAINDRFANTDILVPATATSSSNGYIAGASQVLREAIEKYGYDWQLEGPTLPDAMMSIFKKTGVAVNDPPSGQTFQRLDLLAALDAVAASR